MGMDVYGQNPTSSTGEYFRNNVWHWRPLAVYIGVVAPGIAQHCKSWHYNDGGGLDATQSRALAEVLQGEIDSQRTLKYEKTYRHELETLPDVPCHCCKGTGVFHGKTCHVCEGNCTTRPWETYYPFSVSNVQEFVHFLRDCGGFKIW